MKKLLLVLGVSLILFSCSGNDGDNDPNGEVYFKATVSPGLSGLDKFSFGTDEVHVLVETGTSFQTDKFLFPKNSNLVYQVGFLDSENQCYTVNIEVFFNDRSIDRRTFEMNQPMNLGYVTCKDSYLQTLNVITPK